MQKKEERSKTVGSYAGQAIAVTLAACLCILMLAGTAWVISRLLPFCQ